MIPDTVTARRAGLLDVDGLPGEYPFPCVKKMLCQPKVSQATNANLVGSGEYQSDGISAIYNRR